MDANLISMQVDEALEVLRPFFATLLGDDATLTASEPVEAEEAVLGDEQLLVLAQPSEGTSWAVCFDPTWASSLSESFSEDSPNELNDLVSRAYSLLVEAPSFPSLPETSFVAADSVAELSTPLQKVTFSLTHNDSTYEGSLLVPQALLAPAEVDASDAPASMTSQNDGVAVAAAAFEDFGNEHIAGGDGSTTNLELLSDVELEVTVELGRRRIPLSDVLRLTTGSVIELEKLVGQPLDVYANGRLIAEGEAVVIDEQFGIRITALASRNKQEKALL